MATLQAVPSDSTNSRQHRGQMASAINALQRSIAPLLATTQPTFFDVEADYGASVSAADNSAAIQAAHDAAEANLGGYLIFRSGAVYKCNETITWDPRLVGAFGNGCTLDFSGSTPSNLGAQLIPGQDSSLSGGNIGDWALVSASASAGNGVRITNTTDGVQGYMYLALTTTAGTTYTVNYTMTQLIDNGPQLNVYAGNSIDKGDLGYCAGQNAFWFTFIATSTTTYITVRNATSVIGDQADIENITVQVAAPSGILMKDRSGALYPTTNQFGHDAYSFEGFILIGPGRDTTYIVDAISPLQQYGGPKGSFGIFFNSPNVEGNRNGTSSRGAVRNIKLLNWGAGLAFGNQCYLNFPDVVEVYNCNFGVLGIASATNSGENITISGATLSGCDVNACSDGVAFNFMYSSLDFPKQAQIRLTGGTPVLRFCHSHVEGSPPGQSTQLVAPISLIALDSGLVFDTCELMVTGDYTPSTFNGAFMATNSARQSIVLDDCLINNIVTPYLVSGPGRVTVATPSRFLRFPSIPTLLNDQGASQASMDKYGFGDFEKPVIGAGNKPRGLLALGSTLDDISFNQTWNGRFSSNRMSLVLSNAIPAFKGGQTLGITKLLAAGLPGVVYFLAPCRPGFQNWWTFQIYVAPSASGSAAANITVSQDYTQLLGVETIWPTTGSFAGMSSQASAGYPFNLAGPSNGVGQVFVGNSPQGGLAISASSGSGGWQQFQTDTFNHGTFKAPTWASHCLLKLDFNQFDGPLWGGTSAYIDELQCWEL